MRTEDGHIIHKCLNGEPEAFGFLVDKYKESVYAFAYTRLRNFHDAEDVTQEVFIKAYKNLRSLKRWESFLAWLYSIASNLCKNWVRKQSRRPDSEAIEDEALERLEIISLDSYREELARRSLRDDLEEALDSLPETYRLVLTLHYLGGLSYKEIARFLGKSPAAVKQQISRARAQMKKEMLVMMSGTYERHRLPTGFTFHIVEAVKRVKIEPMPRINGLPWGVSLATGIIIAVLGLGSQSNLSDQFSAFMGSASPMETTAIDDVDVPVDVLTGFQTPLPTGSHDGAQQNTYPLAGKGDVRGKPQAAPMAPLQPDNRNVDLVWHDPIGSIQDVYVVDNHAYLCTGLSLVTLDISDPKNLTQIGLLDIRFVRGIDLAGNYAYIAAAGNGIRIVDISDPGNPREVGSCDTPGSAHDVYVEGNYAYVADYSGGLCVIDISDPGNPEKVGECDISGEAVKVHVASGYAYIAARDDHLRIIDVSDPGNPREVSFCSTPDGALDVCVVDSYAYVAGDEAGLRVIDISDPQNPREAGFYNTPGYAYGVHVAEGYVYLADHTTGFYIIDVSDPGNPRKVGSCDPPGSESKVYVADSRAYVAGSNGLQIIDTSDRTRPREVGFYDTPGCAWGLYVDKGYAYIAEGNNGMRIVDVSDPNNPRARGTWDTPRYSRRIHVVDGYAYIADLDFYVVDVSDPDNPREAGRYKTQGALYGIYVLEDYAYVTDIVKGLIIIDISNPKRPFEAGSFSMPWATGGGSVYVEDGYAFVKHWDIGLLVIDVSNPRNPREVGSCDITEPMGCIHVANGYAYVYSYVTGLSIVDVSNPRRPVEVGSLKADISRLKDIYAAGNYVYLGADNLHIIDVSDPRNPKEVGFYGTLSSSIEDLQFVDGLVYAAVNTAGLYILKPDLAGMPVQPMGKLPSQWSDLKDGKEEVEVPGEYDFALIQNYPNPFNPETWIPFSLPKPGNVIIRIYSSSGQLIRTLDMGQKPPGAYLSREKAAYWDGSNDAGEPVASDVYFYVMEAGESSTDVRKMVMVR